MACINQVYQPSAWARLDQDVQYQIEAIRLIRVILINGSKDRVEWKLILQAVEALIEQKIEDIPTWIALQQTFKGSSQNSMIIEKLVSQLDEIIERLVASYSQF